MWHWHKHDSYNLPSDPLLVTMATVNVKLLVQQYPLTTPYTDAGSSPAFYITSLPKSYTQENQYKFDLIQRSGARYVKNNNSHKSRVTEMIKCLGQCSWQQHHVGDQLILLYKMINGHVNIICIAWITQVTSSQLPGFLDTFTQHPTRTSYHMNKRSTYNSHSFIEQ